MDENPAPSNDIQEYVTRQGRDRVRGSEGGGGGGGASGGEVLEGVVKEVEGALVGAPIEGGVVSMSAQWTSKGGSFVIDLSVVPLSLVRCQIGSVLSGPAPIVSVNALFACHFPLFGIH